MAYVAPTTRADGYVVDATEWNKNTVDNPIALRAGELAIASQAQGDVITAASASQLSRVAPSTAGQALISNGAGMAPSFQNVTVPSQANGDVIIADSTTGLTRVAAGAAGTVLTGAGSGSAPTFAAQTYGRIAAASGTTTSTSAENVATVAVSGLDAGDTLVAHLTIEAITQNVASVVLYNATDGVAIVDVWDSGFGAMTAGRESLMTMTIRRLQTSATAIMATGVGGTDANAAVQTQARSAFTTNWDGSWSLALRHGGVTSGGTFAWSWTVYRLRGA